MFQQVAEKNCLSQQIFALLGKRLYVRSGTGWLKEILSKTMVLLIIPRHAESRHGNAWLLHFLIFFKEMLSTGLIKFGAPERRFMGWITGEQHVLLAITYCTNIRLLVNQLECYSWWIISKSSRISRQHWEAFNLLQYYQKWWRTGSGNNILGKEVSDEQARNGAYQEIVWTCRSSLVSQLQKERSQLLQCIMADMGQKKAETANFDNKLR